MINDILNQIEYLYHKNEGRMFNFIRDRYNTNIKIK